MILKMWNENLAHSIKDDIASHYVTQAQYDRDSKNWTDEFARTNEKLDRLTDQLAGWERTHQWQQKP
jgi:hypothetical protein